MRGKERKSELRGEEEDDDKEADDQGWSKRE